MTNTLLLRMALAVILFSHSFFSIVSGDVNHFGRDYLDKIGFEPLGLPLAWMIKLTHLLSIPFLLLNRQIKTIAIANILIFVAGIVLIHFKEGWFVVGGGRNGMEFNFLLICCFLSLMFPNGLFPKLTPRQS
jgi:putative oxidoreductase